MFVGMRLRTYFSLHHAQMAAFHARSAAAIELDGSEETAVAMSAHVSGAVICAGAFIDATANEHAENDKKPRTVMRGMPAALLRINELLEDAGKPPIPHTNVRWQAAHTLIDLRNRLIHYQHDWLDAGTANMVGANNLYDSTLQPRLESAFAFLPSTHHYGPRFLSPECAAWAINTATAFLDEFYVRLGQKPNHDHLRPRIEVQRPAQPPLT